MSAVPPPLPPRPAPATPPPRGWWQRHWKWALPALVLTCVSVIVALVATVLFAIRSSMMTSDVYRDAMRRATTHPELVASLGAPVEAGFMPMGSIRTSSEDGGAGRADLVIFVGGPAGKGQLVAAADRRLGAWTYESLIFVPESGTVDDVIRIAEPDTPVEHHPAP